MRPPLPLYQTNPDACVHYVLAQVMYMLGAGNEPDARAVMRKLAPVPEGVTLTQAAIFLSEQKRPIVFVDSLDHERFLREGIDYVRERYQPWTAGHEEFFSPLVVRQQQQEVATLRRRARCVSRLPLVQDLDDALHSGSLVVVSLKIGEFAYHCALLYGLTSKNYLVYEPSRDHGGLKTISAAEPRRRWSPDEGMIITS